MKEAKLPDVQLALRDDGGLDLHLNGPDVERRNRVLRALELGGPPGIVAVDLGFSPPAVAVVPRQPAPQQDDEALVEELGRTAYETPTPDGDRYSWNEAQLDGDADILRSEIRIILAHLRSQGLMRTPEDVDMAARRENLLRMRSEDKAEKLSLANELSVAQAQVRALTAKAEEANRELERVLREAPHWAEGGLITQADWEQTSQLAVSEKARANKAQADLATTEQAYQREQVARKRAEYELTELRQACTVQPRWAGGRPVTQAEWDRYVALAAEVPQLKAELEETK